MNIAALVRVLPIAALFVLPMRGLQGQEYQATTVAHGATLTGLATFEGDVPRARRFMITRDIEVCGLGYRERQEVEVSNERGLRNVVISIAGIDAGKPWPEPEGRIEITQQDCVFSPHVQVVPAGREIDIINPDPVLHNVHAFEIVGSNARTMFNFGQPPEQRVITTALRPRRGNVVRVECDAHDFMLGWIYSADTPYTTMADADGIFRIEDIPPGTYTVTAWHPYLGVQEAEIELSPDGEGELVFRFSR